MGRFVRKGFSVWCHHQGGERAGVLFDILFIERVYPLLFVIYHSECCSLVALLQQKKENTVLLVHDMSPVSQEFLYKQHTADLLERFFRVITFKFYWISLYYTKINTQITLKLSFSAVCIRNTPPDEYVKELRASVDKQELLCQQKTNHINK